ncbi:hypothetical protein FOZ63_014980, partial [Perkinsus olseni]
NVLNTRSTLVPQFKPGDLVLFKIVKSLSLFVYKVRGGGESFIAHADNLKAYRGKKRVLRDEDDGSSRKKRRNMVRVALVGEDDARSSSSVVEDEESRPSGDRGVDHDH